MTRLRTLALIALLSVPTLAISADIASAPPDTGLARVASYPIFAQILTMAYPPGFVAGDEIAKGPSYLRESVLKGETVDDWSQMISVSGAQGAALKPGLTPDSVVEFFARNYRAQCPQSMSSANLGTGGLAAFSGRVMVLSCGTANTEKGAHSEAMLLIVLKGREDYYTIQWATRGPATPTAKTINRDEWIQRLRQLQEIKVSERPATGNSGGK